MRPRVRGCSPLPENTFLDSTRRAKACAANLAEATKAAQDADPPVAAGETQGDEALAAREMLEIVNRALATQSALVREAFILVRFEGLSMSEAAEVLGTTEAAVKVRAFRANEAVREALTRSAREEKPIIMTEHRQLLDIPDPLASSQHAPPPMPLLPAVKSATRAERKRSLTFVIAAAVVYQIAWLAFVEHRADLSRSSPTLLALGVIVPLVLAFAALSAAVGRGPRGLGVSVVALRTAILATPVSLSALASLVIASQITDETDRFLDRAIRCIAVTCALSACRWPC